MACGRRQVEGDMWPNCLGAVRKAAIRCLHLATGMSLKRDIGVGVVGAVLSIFYVLMTPQS